MPAQFKHPRIPLPDALDDLTFGDLFQLAFKRGVGNFDRSANDALPWTEEDLAEKIYQAQVKRIGENKAKRPGEDTIRSWMSPTTRGPGPSYWIDVLRCLTPASPAAQANLPWRDALERARINAQGNERLKRRRTPKEGAEPVGLIPADPPTFDIEELTRRVARVDDDPAFRFASKRCKAERLIGAFDLSFPEAQVDTDAQRLAVLLHKTKARIVLRSVGKSSDEEIRRDLLRVALGVSETKTAFTADHLLVPARYPALAAVAQRCAGTDMEDHADVDTTVEAAFFEELGQHLGRYRGLIQALLHDDPDAATVWATLQISCHHQHLRSALERPMLSDRFARGGEPFSIRDVYVDLPMEPDVGEIEEYEDSYSDDSEQRIQTREAFKAFLSADWRLAPDKTNFLALRGLPGSGKTTAAKVNCAALQAADPDLAVVFLPLQKHGPFLDTDQTLIVRGETPTGFLPTSDGIDLLALFEASRFRRLLIVLDGLDELGSQTEHQHQVAGLSRALKLVDHAAKSKPVKFVVAGRHQAFGHLVYPEFLDQDVLRLIGMAMPSFLIERDGPVMVESDLGYVFDHRMEWFRRFMRFKYGLENVERPNVLKSHFHQLADLTFEPLLLFLLFRLGENLSRQLHYLLDDGREIPDFDRIFEMGELHGLSKNDLYQMIIWSIRNPVHRDRGGVEASSRQGGLPENAFEKTLGCLAVAAWRNKTGRRATVEEFLAEASRQGLRDEALRFVSTARGRDPDSAYANMSLLSVFYFQGFEREGSDTDEFEFTHKSFAEYLVAAHIFEKAVRLLDDVARAPLVPDDPRIAGFVDLVGDGEESIQICQYLQEEGIRYGRRRTILFETPRGVLHLYPRQGQELPLIDPHRFEALVVALIEGDARAGRAARFLVAIWDAIVEGDETGQHGSIAPKDLSFKTLFQRVADPISFDELDSINSALVPTNIAKYAINNWELDQEDLSGLNLMNASFYHCSCAGAKFVASPLCNSGFNHCDLSNAYLLNCDASSAHFYYAGGFSATASQFMLCVFEDSSFHKNSFEHVDFRVAEWIATAFEACDFRRCDFSKGLFRSARFVDCSFVQCAFDGLEVKDLSLKNCQFEQCSGVDPDWL